MVDPQQTNGKTGRKPSSDDLFWIGAMRGVIGDSIAGVHQAALGLLALAGLSWLGYALVLFWDIESWTYANAALLTIALLPLPCWIAACVYALQVLLVRRYRYFANSPDASEQAFERTVRRKVRDLTRGIMWWVVGAGVVVVVIVVRTVA